MLSLSKVIKYILNQQTFQIFFFQKLDSKNMNNFSWEEDKPNQKYTSFLSLSTGGFLSIRKNGKSRVAKKLITQLGRGELWAYLPA